MISQVRGVTLLGLEAKMVEVEVHITQGLPAFKIVGLPEKSVQEARARVESAIQTSEFLFPAEKVVVNLAPADLPKEGPLLDLPIAIAILAASHQIPKENLKDLLFAGELSLDGRLKKIKGVLSVATKARQEKLKVVLPSENQSEASWVEKVECYALSSLEEVVAFIKDRSRFQPVRFSGREFLDKEVSYPVDFSEIKGQGFAKRALEVAAAGAHNVLMIGPPGSGKTMLAERLPTILPPPTFEEQLEITRIYSVAGLLDTNRIQQRPFRAPHHTISSVALIGGGQKPEPGEVSLAHLGVLFLDELPEFKRDALEVLRQPLEKGKVTISRAKGKLTFPCSFMLVAAMNPCPCGYYGDAQKPCLCTPLQIRRYTQKISGPLLDRIDIHLEVPRLPAREMTDERLGESSKAIRERVIRARKKQAERFGKPGKTNATMSKRELQRFCSLGEAEKKMLATAIDKMGYSARAYDRILKVARTIADLEEAPTIQTHHLAEAMQYRQLDRGPWTL